MIYKDMIRFIKVFKVYKEKKNIFWIKFTSVAYQILIRTTTQCLVLNCQSEQFQFTLVFKFQQFLAFISILN